MLLYQRNIFLKMIEVEKLLQILERNSIKYFTGVPDSVLKERIII